jgi:hypothetical protein
MSEKRPLVTFYAEIYKIETKRDGGGRLTIDFNPEALIPMQMLHRMQINGDTNFACAMVPWYPGEKEPEIAVKSLPIEETTDE